MVDRGGRSWCWASEVEVGGGRCHCWEEGEGELESLERTGRRSEGEDMVCWRGGEREELRDVNEWMVFQMLPRECRYTFTRKREAMFDQCLHNTWAVPCMKNIRIIKTGSAKV